MLVNTNFRVEDDFYQAMKERAALEERSLSSLIRIAIKEYLKS